MKIYLSGPMTGIPDFNYPLFNKIASELRERGYDVINPAEIVFKDHDRNYKPNSEFVKEKMWQRYMKECLRLLADADMIGRLPGWGYSKGAMLEIEIGERIGIISVDVDTFYDVENV